MRRSRLGRRPEQPADRPRRQNRRPPYPECAVKNQTCAAGLRMQRRAYWQKTAARLRQRQGKAARNWVRPDSGICLTTQQIEGAAQLQALYQAMKPARTGAAAAVAIEYMEQLADFDPHLTRPGTQRQAGRHASITCNSSPTRRRRSNS